MASLYRRKDSPYFWIKYRNQAGRIMQASTGFRLTVALDVRRAKLMCAEKTAIECRDGPRRGDQGWAWVTDFLNTRYGQSLTGRGYRSAWVSIKMFLESKQIDAPANLSRQHCFEYVQWRQGSDLPEGRYPACHNTALMEVRVLAVIMQEAVDREFARGNPCVGLKIKKQPPKVKPELTDEDCAKIRAGILATPDPDIKAMLHYSFEICRFQGCRLMESRLNPQTDVKLFNAPGADGKPVKRGAIYFRVKGGKEFTTVLHPNLIPMFEKLQADGRNHTWKTPAGKHYTWAAARWFDLFKRIGVKACIHSARVTVISELVRANVPESKAKSLVGHSSTLSHRIYQRLKLEDLHDAIGHVGAAPAPNSGEETATKEPHPHQNNEPV